MLRLKPILLFCAAFFLGSALVVYVSLISNTSTGAMGLLWIPVVGSLFGFLAILVRQMSPLWIGITFVMFAIGSFIIFSAQKNIEATESPYTSAEKLERIFESFHPYKRRKILTNLASHPNTPLRVLIELSKKKNELLLAYLGANPNATEEMLEPLMQIKHSAQRHWGLAANPHITHRQIEYLIHIEASNFENPEQWQLYKTHVLAKLMKNPALSEEQAQKAASHLEATQ